MFDAKEIEHAIINYASGWMVEDKENVAPIVQESTGLAKYLAKNSNEFFPQDYYTQEDLDTELDYVKNEYNENLDSVDYRIDDLDGILLTLTLDAEDEAKILDAVEGIRRSVNNARYF